MATYDYLKSKNGHKIQVESAKRDGAGKNIENNYAKQNGYYAQLTAGLADNLTPYSEDSGDLQENPFISNGTGTNNNQEIVTVGDYALVQEKQGNSVVVNQLVNYASLSTYTHNGITYTNNNNGSFTLSGLASGNSYYTIFDRTSITDNHYYLILGCASGGSTSSYMIRITNNLGTDLGYDTGNGIVVRNTGGIGAFMRVISGTDLSGSNAKKFVPVIIDLNQWGFTADEIADITANPSHFFWYYNGSLAYNTGSLENANGVKLVSTGRQLWDEQWEVGRYDTTTGASVSSSSNIRSRSKNYIRVIPNTSYYLYNGGTDVYIPICFYDKDKNFISSITTTHNGSTFTTPINACFIRFYVHNSYGTTYNHDITISLYYTPEQGGEGYDKYYPYEEPNVVDTGTETLLSVGNLRNYKTKDGVIHRVVDYSNELVFELFTDGGPNVYRANISNRALTKNVWSAKYFNNKTINASNSLNDKEMFVSTSSTYIYVKDSSGTPSGVFYYELAQETTEQGTPYPETLPINDYGMLYWLDSNDNLVGIPQGAKIFFPVNYKGFLDDVYSRTSGDAENLVIQSELSASETERDTVDAQLLNAVGGTLRQCLCVKASLGFDSTNAVDLGSLSWTYYAGYSGFMAVIADVKKANTSSQEPNMICSKYRTAISYSDYDGSTKSLYTWNNLSGNNIVIRDTSFGTDADSFKAAMKGVLLAYEKA